MAVWARFVEKADARIYGLSFDWRGAGDVFAGLTFGFAAVALMFAAGVAIGVITSVEARPVSFGSPLPSLVIRTLLVALWEEAFFRGVLIFYLSSAFVRTFGPLVAGGLAVVLSSIFFALAHGATDHFNLTAFVILALNGIVWCLPVLLTSRLGLSIGLHAAWNFGQLQVFGFAMSGNSADRAWIGNEITHNPVWTGGDYGPEAGLLGIIGLAAMAVAAVVFCFATGRSELQIATFSD